MKHYFNYGADLSSKEVSEAIAMVHGSGPIIGFGKATIDSANNKIVIYPLPSESDPMYRIMLGRQKQWNISKAIGDTEPAQTKFAGIAKDGCIFSDGSNTLTVPITGTKGNFNEVLVFAVHTPINEPVSNPVTFMAFWSEATYAFYQLYQSSLDPYYPLPLANRKYDFFNNSGINNDLNYDEIETKAAESCTYYASNRGSLSLMGIYGTGDNPITGAVRESFALVPYNGEFPDSISYTPAIHRSLRLSLSRLEAIIGENTSGSEAGITTIAELLSALKNDILDSVKKDLALVAMPIGSIILWSGTDIPEGWREYTEAAGRVVVGYQYGGIYIPNSTDGDTLKVELSEVGSIFNPQDGNYYTTIDSKNLPIHRHGLGITLGDMDNDDKAGRSVVQGWSDRDMNKQGDVGDYGPTKHVINGGIYTSNNFMGTDQQESTHNRLNLIKLPKAITLKYIIKER